MELLTILMIVYLIFLTKRVNKLEMMVRKTELVKPLSPIPAAQTSTPTPQMHPDVPTPEPAFVVAATTPEAVPAVSLADLKPAEMAFFTWLKQDFLVKVGAFLLLLAVGWFVSYAFTNNWISPFGRILLGVALGVAISVLGVWRIKTHVHQGSVFVALGSGMIFLTIFAARYIYNFFTPGTALLIMFLSVAFASSLAVVRQVRELAIMSLVLGALAPLLTNAPEPTAVGLFTYLLALILGAIVVTGLLQAEVLILIALLVVFFYSLPFISGGAHLADMQIATLFGFLFTIIFFLSNIISILRRKTVHLDPVHIVVAVMTGLFVSFWIKTGSVDRWEGTLFTLWAAAFTGGAYMVRTRTKRDEPFYVYGAVAIGLLGAATAAFLSGPTLAIAFTLEVTALVVLAARLIEANIVTQRISFLYLGPVLLSIEHILAPAWQNSVLHKHFGVLMVLMAGFFAASVFLGTSAAAAKRRVGAVLAVFGVIYGLVLTALILQALLADQLALTLTLGSYAGLGSMIYVIGLRLLKPKVSQFGALLALSHILLMFATIPHLTASNWRSGVFHSDFGALVFVTAVFWLTGVAAVQKTVKVQSLIPAKILLALAGGYTGVLVWLISHALLATSIATTFSLILYTVVGLGIYIFGKLHHYMYTSRCGAVVITGVVLRLLLVEVWALSLTMRIITFFVVGALLISTAFIGKRNPIKK